MTTTVQKWGNSQGIRIPKSVLNEINVENGECVELIIENGMLLIKKAEKTNKRKSIEELFCGYAGNYQCNELDWGEKEGLEEW